MPYTTLIHSAPLMASKLPCSAMAAPVRPAISEWLWLVGMPKYQATVPHTMMATMAAMRAMSDCWESPPKSTILNMVGATAAVNRETTSSPRKLQTAAMSPCRYDGCDRVRSVRRPIHDDDADVEQGHNHEDRVGREPSDERSPLYGHEIPLDNNSKKVQHSPV